MGWIDDLARRIGRDANVSAAVNVAKGRGAKTTVRRHQKIVQRNGETTVTTEDHVSNPKEAADDRAS